MSHSGPIANFHDEHKPLLSNLAAVPVRVARGIAHPPARASRRMTTTTTPAIGMETDGTVTDTSFPSTSIPMAATLPDGTPTAGTTTDITRPTSTTSVPT